MIKPGRNEPCPCGSGRKFKLCHGAIAVAPAPPAAASLRHAGAVLPGPSAERECGTCTACCEGWAEGEIRGHRMRPGVPCHFLGPGGAEGTGPRGCTIYEERPQSPCRNFVCGWLMEASPFPEAFRPDRLGVIVVPLPWRGTLSYILLSAGREPGDALVGWMQAHSRQTGRPFFYERSGERLGYGPREFLLEMAGRMQRGEKLW